jgi:hypothetical protein
MKKPKKIKGKRKVIGYVDCTGLVEGKKGKISLPVIFSKTIPDWDGHW